jgi:hypothetical protein
VGSQDDGDIDDFVSNNDLDILKATCIIIIIDIHQ